MDLLIDDVHTALQGEPPEACLLARASVTARARVVPSVRPHHHGLPLRVGTRASPLALVQTRAFLALLSQFCPVLRGMDVFQEHAIRTTGDATQSTGERLADIGGKGCSARRSTRPCWIAASISPCIA